LGYRKRWNSGAYFYGFKKGLIKMENPLLYAYGSYGPMDAYFSSTDYPYSTGLFMPLRTFEVGEDLGRQWYEGGKLLKKKNTFKFLACSPPHRS
jgi:oligopeptidase B